LTDLYQEKHPEKPKLAMKLESTKPTTPRERQLRRQTHAKAILKGLTMRQAVYQALELWLKQGHE